MQRAAIDGIELQYEVNGGGEPIVLMHAGVCADFFAPLAEEPALVEGFCVVRYHRVGYAGSTRLPGAVDLAQQAAHCRGLMRHLGLERAHVVGHSSSASMALQLALDAPEAVQSLALLDAARPAVPSAVQSEMVRTVAEPALERYGAGDREGAVHAWMRGVCGPDYRDALARALPEAFDQAVADADTFFEQELPAVQRWTFGREEAARITQPVLLVLGQRSAAVFRERRDLLLDWLPTVESFELPDATHLLQVENPSGLAAALAAFFSRHRFQSSAARSVSGDPLRSS